MVLTIYYSLFLFKNYNILIVYDYRYYCDFNNFILSFNSIDNGGVRIHYPCPNTEPFVIIRTPYIQLDTLHIIDESIIKITITLSIINLMNNLF